MTATPITPTTMDIPKASADLEIPLTTRANLPLKHKPIRRDLPARSSSRQDSTTLPPLHPTRKEFDISAAYVTPVTEADALIRVRTTRINGKSPNKAKGTALPSAPRPKEEREAVVKTKRKRRPGTNLRPASKAAKEIAKYNSKSPPRATSENAINRDESKIANELLKQYAESNVDVATLDISQGRKDKIIVLREQADIEAARKASSQEARDKEAAIIDVESEDAARTFTLMGL